jgi:hypothetical protein
VGTAKVGNVPVITTILLNCDSVEVYALDGSDTPGPLLKAQAWLADRGWPKLTPLQEGGVNAPSVGVWASDFNRMGDEATAFADYVVSLPWSFPESVLLVLHPEEGDARVYRPEFTPSDIWRN